MSNLTTNISFGVDTLANFNFWGAAISAVFDTMGLTKTSDTGQVNWSTNSSAPSGTYPAYEIRQPASDALQTGSTAYYLKVEYGSASVAQAPSLRFSLGTSTNGAGTLTGFFTTAMATAAAGTFAAGSGTATVYESNIYYDASSFAGMFWRTHGSPNGPVFIGIERTKNSDGTDGTDGVTLVVIGVSTNRLFQTLVFGKAVTAALNIVPTIDTGGSAGTGTDGFNNSTPISPAFPIYGKWGNPMTILASTRQSDMVESGLVASTLYSSSITYMGSKNGTLPVLGAGKVQALLMRWS